MNYDRNLTQVQTARAEASLYQDADREGQRLFWITEVLTRTDLKPTRSKIGGRI